MRKNICALFVVLLILLMMGCAATTKDAVDVEIKNDSTEVSVDSENETTESSTTEKETVDENTDTPENTEDNKEESEQEPELSEEEKHAALLEKINTQQETCKMLNDMNMGNKYSCFYDESTNTFTYNMDVSGAADFVPSDAFNDLINSSESFKESPKFNFKDIYASCVHVSPKEVYFMGNKGLASQYLCRALQNGTRVVYFYFANTISSISGIIRDFLMAWMRNILV